VSRANPSAKSQEQLAKGRKWVKGMKSPNPAGRPRGTKDRVRVMFDEADAAGFDLAEFGKAIVSCDPGACARMRINVRKCTLELRVRVWGEMMPFEYSKKPVALQAQVEVAKKFDLTKLSDEEISQYLAIAAKLGVTPSESDIDAIQRLDEAQTAKVLDALASVGFVPNNGADDSRVIDAAGPHSTYPNVTLTP